MPDLLLDKPEPFAATLGVMLYPSADDMDERKAKTLAAHYLAEPLLRLYKAAGALTLENLSRIAMDGGATGAVCRPAQGGINSCPSAKLRDNRAHGGQSTKYTV